MDKNQLYSHFANLGLVVIGLFSIQSILSPVLFLFLITGTIAGFLVSWQLRDYKIPYMDVFIGMLSLASVVIILGHLYDMSITFESLLKVFSTALVWLTFFQSFGLKVGRGYAVMQFISVCLFITSVGLALEQENFYIVLVALYLFLFIFTMRLGLVGEKKRKGSIIVGDQEEVMSLYNQVKIGAIMFSIILIISAFLYPFIPRFENLSFRWIPSTLLGIPESVSVLKLLTQAPKIIKEDKSARDERHAEDKIKKRETSVSGRFRRDLKGITEQTLPTRRFPSKEFNEDINIFKIKSLLVWADKDKVPLDSQTGIHAELKMNDGTVVPATRLVDWRTTGTAEVSINSKGNLTPKTKGYIRVSASYMGTFSNEVKINIIEPITPIRRRSWVYYVFMSLISIIILAFLIIIILVFWRSRKLIDMAETQPREFIKEIYAALCRGFRFYGAPRLHYFAHREFMESVKDLVSLNPEAMSRMTDNVLEARFSRHQILPQHAYNVLHIFHDIKQAILEREEKREVWKKILFSIFLIDVLLIPRQAI